MIHPLCLFFMGMMDWFYLAQSDFLHDQRIFDPDLLASYEAWA
jgi:hypothetical protein